MWCVSYHDPGTSHVLVLHIARSQLCRGRGQGLRFRGSHFRGRSILGLAQARQLRDGPPFFATEQVVVLVDGHFDAGVAHELAHGRDVAAFTQKRRGEQVSYVVHDHRIGQSGLFRRRLQGPAKLAQRLALVLDDETGLGLLPHDPEPLQKFRRDGDDAGGLRLGGVDLDAAVVPVDVVPGQGQQFGLPGTHAKVPGDLDGPGKMWPGRFLELHEVRVGELGVPGPFLGLLPAFQRVLGGQLVVDAVLEDHLEVGQVARPSRLAAVGVDLADDLDDFLEADFVDGPLSEHRDEVGLHQHGQ